MKYYKLDWYIDKLKSGEHFSLARYGDGEFLCMWGKNGGNSNGCRYSPELREALLDSMKREDDPSFIYGVQRVLPQDANRIQKEYPNIDWHDSEFLSEAVAEGSLFPFIKQLQKMNTHFLVNESIEPFIKVHFPKSLYTIIPPSNAFDYPFPINPIDDTVYLFSAGMASNAWISKLHGKSKCWLIDVGHIWDPFVGNMSRCDLEGKSMEEINQNLYDR